MSKSSKSKKVEVEAMSIRWILMKIWLYREGERELKGQEKGFGFVCFV